MRSFVLLHHSAIPILLRQDVSFRFISKIAKISGLALLLLLPSVVFGQTTVKWTMTTAATAWYTNTNWTPNRSSEEWLTNDLAQFEDTGTATTSGINMNTAQLSIGAIEVTSARTRNLTIGNSSETSNGTLTLNGISVNSVNNVILRNASNNDFTIQNTQGSGNKTMAVALGNATANIINIDGSGGITISSIITGSGSLTKAGTGSGVLTLSGANTYAGGTTITAGTLRLGAAGVLADGGAITLNGGTLRTGATTGFSETVGTLNLNASSTIALGTGVHTLTFAASNAVTWAGTTLTITGWTGTAGASGTAGKIFVGNNTTGLTAAQLAKISFTGYSAGAVLLSTGELVPCTTPTVSVPSGGTFMCSNGTGSFSISATVTAVSPIYQWQRSLNGIDGWVDITASTQDQAAYNVTYAGFNTASTLDITLVSLNTVDKIYYRLIVNSGSCAATSNSFNLSFQSCWLPIELLSFEGKAVGERIQLRWRTARETNNAYMAVERSRDGIHFVELDRVKGFGNSYIKRSYDWVDKYPLPGVNYYRLRQVDTDGKVEYHKVIAVEMKPSAAGSLLVYPSPTSDRVIVALGNLIQEKETARLKIFDVQGRLVRAEVVAGNADLQKSIDVSDFVSGTYIISIQTNQYESKAKFLKVAN